jgi:capsular polysaccharide biosynthesis protein
MLRNLIARIFSQRGSARVFLAVAAAVWALIFGVSVIGSSSVPRVYVSTVRIKLVPSADNSEEANPGHHEVSSYSPWLVPTECEVMRSAVILARVANALDSKQTESHRQLRAQERLGIPGRIAQLTTQIKVRPVPNTNVVEICVLSEDRDEAAQIANALGEIYYEYQADLVKRVPRSVPSLPKAEVMNRALTTSRPEGLKTLLGVARHALGAALLGAVAGSVVVFVAFRRRVPMTTAVLPWLSMIVLFLVLGVSALKSSLNLAVATSAGLLLAFVVGGVADWFISVRKKHPEAPNVFPAVFMAVFLLVLGVGILNAVISPAYYCSTVRLRLGLGMADPARPGTAMDSSAVYDAELIKTQCDAICSESILRPVIVDLDLNRQWGRRFSDGGPLKTLETIEFLKGRIDVRRIPDTCLVEIRAVSEKAEEAARLANALAETYRDHRRDSPAASPSGPMAIRAEILDPGMPAADALPYYKLRQLTSPALAALCLAFAVGGGATWTVSRAVKARSRFAQQASSAPVSRYRW